MTYINNISDSLWVQYHCCKYKSQVSLAVFSGVLYVHMLIINKTLRQYAANTWPWHLLKICQNVLSWLVIKHKQVRNFTNTARQWVQHESQTANWLIVSPKSKKSTSAFVLQSFIVQSLPQQLRAGLIYTNFPYSFLKHVLIGVFVIKSTEAAEPGSGSDACPSLIQNSHDNGLQPTHPCSLSTRSLSQAKSASCKANKAQSQIAEGKALFWEFQISLRVKTEQCIRGKTRKLFLQKYPNVSKLIIVHQVPTFSFKLKRQEAT